MIAGDDKAVSDNVIAEHCAALAAVTEGKGLGLNPDGIGQSGGKPDVAIGEAGRVALD